jgi:hypothetical protein
MHVSPLTFQFKHFEKHRELAKVAKQSLDANERQAVWDMVDDSYRYVLQADNQAGDLDPIEGRVLMSTVQGVVSAQHSQDESGRHLQRTNAQSNGISSLLSAHLREDGMDMANYIVTPGCGGTLMCYHVDFADPANDFVQRTSSGPARPAAGPSPNYNR